MLRIGDEITRHDGRRFKLVGTRDGQWIATALDCFAPPLPISARDLSNGFDVEDPTPPDVNESDIMRQSDHEATVEANHAYGRVKAADEPRSAATVGPPPGSPEAFFASLAEKTDDAAD